LRPMLLTFVHYFNENNVAHQEIVILHRITSV
jgi:hypothetical protein